MKTYYITPDIYERLMIEAGELKYGDPMDRYFVGMLCGDLPSNGIGPIGEREVVVLKTNEHCYLARSGVAIRDEWRP